MKDYHINVFYSEDDEGYIADIPDLQHCSAFGVTPEEALQEVLKAKQVWLEAARASGKPIPAPLSHEVDDAAGEEAQRADQIEDVRQIAHGVSSSSSGSGGVKRRATSLMNASGAPSSNQGIDSATASTSGSTHCRISSWEKFIST